MICSALRVYHVRSNAHQRGIKSLLIAAKVAREFEARKGRQDVKVHLRQLGLNFACACRITKGDDVQFQLLAPRELTDKVRERSFHTAPDVIRVQRIIADNRNAHRISP